MSAPMNAGLDQWLFPQVAEGIVFQASRRHTRSNMTTSRTGRKHLASSPFAPKPEPVIEVYNVGDKVCHDLYGMGRVIGCEAHAVSVDFGARTVRIPSPYPKLQHL